MMRFAFVIPGRPCGVNEAYAGRGGRGRDRRLTPEGSSYKQLAAHYALQAAKRAGVHAPLDHAIGVRLGFFFATMANDIDGPIKLTLDALQLGRVLVNDNRILRLEVTKARDATRPRTEVELYDIPAGSEP